MKCVKCGKESEQCKCRSCGFDICSRKFSGIYKMNSKSINAINSLIKSSQVFKYDNESIEYGSTVRSGAAVSNKRATETPNKSGHNNSVPTTPQRRKKGRLLWPSLIIVMCAVIAFIVVKHMGRQFSSDSGLIVIPANTSIGDTITFGNYEQDADLSNGAEPIQWFVADTSEGKALLVSKKCLDCMPYSIANSNSWTDSDVRKWLNDDFYSNSFSDEEQACISESAVVSGYPVLPSDYMHEENTSDKVFVLDHNEYRKYVFGDAKLSAYARKEYLTAICNSDCNTYESTEEEYCSNESEYGENYSWCLLRNIGPIENTVQFVSWFDEVGIAAVGNGFCDASGCVAIRPAIWVYVDSDKNNNDYSNLDYSAYLDRYNLKNATLIRNSLPSNLCNRYYEYGVSIPLSVESNAEIMKEELMDELRNPVWLAARFKYLSSLSPEVNGYLDNDNIYQKMGVYIRLFAENGVEYFVGKQNEDGEFPLTDEYLKYAAIGGMLFDETQVEIQNDVPIIQRWIIDDAEVYQADGRFDLSKIKILKFYYDEPYVSDVLALIHKKDDEIIYTEYFDVYDRAPVIVDNESINVTKHE